MAGIQSKMIKGNFVPTKDTRVKCILRLVRDVLKDKGVPERYYSLDGYADMANCIEFLGNQWIVYYGERGNQNRRVSFAEDKEDEAILSFFQRVFSDTIAAEEAYVAYKSSRFVTAIAIRGSKVCNVKLDVVVDSINTHEEKKTVETEKDEFRKKGRDVEGKPLSF